MELASMLPGFRFLFSAIILSISVLIFGLGAAALLRSAHEEFANLPSRRATPSPMFARLGDDQPPTLALLRVDPIADKPADNYPATAADVLPSGGQAQETIPAEAEQTAALTPAEPPQIEAAKPEEPVTEANPETPAAPGSEVRLAAVAALDAGAAAPPATSPQQAGDIPSFEPSIATTLIATLGGPPVQIEQTASTAEAKPDRRTVKNKAAQRARERRRIAAIRRARLAREATLTLQQQQPNPFAFPLAPATR